MRVWTETEVIAIDRRKITFSVKAYDERGLIGEGTHERFIIKDTTSIEHIQIVKDALDGEYDEFYDDYVAGKKELSEINREYSEEYAGTGTDE